MKPLHTFNLIAIFILLSSASSLVTAPQGMIRHDVAIEKYREVGRQPQFNCVGRYSTSISSNNYAGGVLIAPNWVLTAAHFVADTSVWTFGETTYSTKRIVKHPKLLPGASETQWTGYDLALVELDRPVTNVSPATRYFGRSEIGTIITKVGYGYVGDGLNGMKTPRISERLGGQNVIDAAGGTVNSRELSPDVLIFDFDSPLSSETNRLGSDKPLDLEVGGSKGDSGGGVFAQFNGTWTLVGIVSGALNREIKYGSIAAVTRVSSANQWIDSVINQTSQK